MTSQKNVCVGGYKICALVEDLPAFLTVFSYSSMFSLAKNSRCYVFIHFCEVKELILF